MSLIKNIHSGIWILALIAMTGICLYPCIFNDFVNWDDNYYVLDNALIKEFSFNAIGKIFFLPGVHGSYLPLSIISLAFDYAINGLEPMTYHVHNLVLHLANVALTFILIKNITKNVLVAFIAAALFGIHPMHVEAVAWISSRKDVLFGFYYLIALITYTRFLQSKSSYKNAWYLATVFAFLLSLASKGMAITLPFVLILMDYFVNKKWAVKALLFKLPWIVLSIVFVLININAEQEAGAILKISDYPFYKTIFLGNFNFWLYGIKFIYPYNLSALHSDPITQFGFIPWYIYASIIPTIILIFFSIKELVKRSNVLFGIIFFAITIVPVLQILPIGISFFGERWTYIPYFGLCLALAEIINTLAKRIERNYPSFGSSVYIILGIYIISLGFTAHLRTYVWKDGSTLWTDVIKKYPGHYLAYANLGEYHFNNNEFEEGLAQLDTCLLLNPGFSKAYNTRGRIFASLAKRDEAISDYSTAIALDSSNSSAYVNRGIIMMGLNKIDEGIVDFNQSIKYNPSSVLALLNRGVALENMGDFDSALKDYSQAIEIDRTDYRGYKYRGVVNFKQSYFTQAVSDFSSAITCEPENFDLYIWRSKSYFELKEYDNARKDAVASDKYGNEIEQEYYELLNMKQYGIE